MFELERAAIGRGARRPAGVDEAGRGPLAGPVVAACVALPIEEPGLEAALRGLTDSKLLTPRRREYWLQRLRGWPGASISIGWATAAEIDRLNILQATLLAMRRAALRLRPPPDFLLVDGPTAPDMPAPTTAIVGGDRLSVSIAAASIVAKVVRDRHMAAMDRRHPGYGFARHKGYGTRQHLEALRRLGPCPAHRRSFRPVADAMLAPFLPRG